MILFASHLAKPQNQSLNNRVPREKKIILIILLIIIITQLTKNISTFQNSENIKLLVDTSDYNTINLEQSKVKLDHWSRDDLYELYLIETLKKEPVEAALQRSIATMMDWATEQNAQWSDYFRLVNTNRAVQHIQQGKISPWLLLGCSAGKRMLKSFSDEQLQMIERFINPSFWPSKLKAYPADHMLVQDTAKEAKIV